MSYSSTSALIWPRTWAYASGWASRARAGSARGCRALAPSAGATRGEPATSESRLTISGSNQRPNSIPRAWTRSTRGRRPSGQTSARQPSRPAGSGSSRRPPNQPSSRTEGSTPILCAALVGELEKVGEVMGEVGRLPRVEQDGPRGCWGGVGLCAQHDGGGGPMPRPARPPRCRRATARCTSRPWRGSPCREGAARRRAGGASRWWIARRRRPGSPRRRREPPTLRRACTRSRWNRRRAGWRRRAPGDHPRTREPKPRCRMGAAGGGVRECGGR